jgi:hypothetical protein
MMPQTITYLAGVARSGTSWLGQLFNSSPEVRFRFQPLFAYEFKNRVNEDSKKSDFNELIHDIYNTESSFLNQDDKRNSGDYPTFLKSEITPHLVFKENRYQNIIEPMMRNCSDINLIGIVRNPNAVLNSWMKNPKEFPPNSDPLNEWRYGDCKNQGHEDFFGYYRWKEVANLYLDLHEKWPKRVYVVSYEHLVKSTQTIVKEMFTHCSISYQKQTDEFIKNGLIAHNVSAYSVFKEKSVVDNWRKELNPYITKEIMHDLEGTRLERFLI